MSTSELSGVLGGGVLGRCVVSRGLGAIFRGLPRGLPTGRLLLELPFTKGGSFALAFDEAGFLVLTGTLAGAAAFFGAVLTFLVLISPSNFSFGSEPRLMDLTAVVEAFRLGRGSEGASAASVVVVDRFGRLKVAVTFTSLAPFAFG